MNRTNDLDDPLDELFRAAEANPTPAPKQLPPAHYQPKSFEERCPRCGGSGQFGRAGRCFKCNGSGKQVFKTSHEHRARARQSAADRHQRAVEGWTDAHPEITAWLHAKAGGTFRIPGEMLAALEKYGSLTDPQVDLCRRLIIQDHERDTARQAQQVERTVAAPTIDVAPIERAFNKASAALRSPKLHLDSFTIKHAPATGKNPGALYVTDSTKTGPDGKPEYLGKIVGGKFLAMRSCGPERQAAVLKAAADPEAATIRYGRLTGRCGCCNRDLTDPVSVERGIGPICAEKYGW